MQSTRLLFLFTNMTRCCHLLPVADTVTAQKELLAVYEQAHDVFHDVVDEPIRRVGLNMPYWFDRYHGPSYWAEWEHNMAFDAWVAKVVEWLQHNEATLKAKRVKVERLIEALSLLKDEGE